MSHDRRIESPGSDVTTMKFDGTELTLALPGEGRSSPAVTAAGGKTNINVSKRGFMETVDLNLNGSFEYISKPRGSNGIHVNDTSEVQVVGTGKSPPSKAQVIGWPPVRSYRKKALDERRSKLVKVAVDGAAYLRKVELTTYGSYEHLLGALREMFSSTFAIRGNNYKENQQRMKGMEYVATYEDKDDDWMLVGDVPWKMFVESCKRIRLMKSSEAMGLGPGTSADCASSS